MNRILVTGAAGFVGYHLICELLKNEENHLTLVDNLSRGRQDGEFRELLDRSNVDFFQVDLTDIGSMKPIWHRYDQVYHLAAVVGVQHCMGDPCRVLRTNIISTMNVIQLVKECGSGKLLFSSSSEVYAGGFELGVVGIPTDETVPLAIADVFNPRLTYASSKMIGEQLVIFNAEGNFDYTIVRYHNVYGPRMGFVHVVPEVVKRILQGESPFKIYGYDQARAFCYVADAVAQTRALMETSDANGQIVHVGNDSEETNIEDLVEKVFGLMSYDAPRERTPAPEGAVSRRCPDTAKVRHLTGLQPRYPLDEGVRLTVEWYQDFIKTHGAWE